MIYLSLFLVYFKIGLFGFGGGYAMLSLIQDEVVNKHHWITPAQFTDIVAISQITPGPIGINSATYIGYTATGTAWGSIIATLAVSMPSFILVFLLSIFFQQFRQNKYVDAALSGIRPASVGLIASAALMLTFQASMIWSWMMDKNTPIHFSDIWVRDNFIDYRSILIFLVVFVLGLSKKVHPIALIVAASLVGVFIF